MLCATSTDAAPTFILAAANDAKIAIHIPHTKQQQQPASHQLPAPTLRKPTALAATTTTAALADDKGELLFYDLARRELLRSIHAHQGPVLDLLFTSHDTVLSSGADRLILTHDLATGEQTGSRKAGKVAVSKLACAPDGRHVLLAASTLRLLRLDTWKRVCRFSGHASATRHAAFSHDGTLLLSAAADRSMSLWAVSYSAKADDDDAPLVASFAFDADVIALGFAPATDAESAASSYTWFALTSDGDLHLWRVSAAALCAPPPKAKKGSKRPPPPRVPPKPACIVRVAAAPGASAAAEDPLRIFHAAFAAPDKLLVAHGSKVRPTVEFVPIEKARSGGALLESIAIRRSTAGILAADANGAAADEGDGKRRKKGEARPVVTTLGAMDMALPTAAATRTEGAAPPESEAPALPSAPTFGDRLAAMQDGSSPIPVHSAAALATQTAGAPEKSRKPTAASQVSLLVQALQNSDSAMLDQALQVQDAHVISATVARLPVTSVLPFLQAVLQRIQVSRSLPSVTHMLA